jgi:hypothetical protein
MEPKPFPPEEPAMPRTAALLAVLLASASVLAAGPTYDDPEKAAKSDPDFLLQGEYSGAIGTGDGERKFGVQVIALGEGKFRAVGYHGGLPGDGWTGEEKVSLEAQASDGVVTFEGDQGSGVLQEGAITLYNANNEKVGELQRVERRSPTLGKEPPEGAVVLFDGSKESLENWKNGRATEDGLLVQGTTSKPTFGDHTLHLEFRLPYQPQDRGQARGNSGVYLQGRYEVQMLDSFGLEGEQNECGGLYSVAKPDVNMCYPPLSWQTYDIDFTAARYDDDGKLASNPRVTVRHNGVVIHDDVELPGERNTTAAPIQPGPQGGPVYLQDHGNPVRYRNIWVVEKK